MAELIISRSGRRLWRHTLEPGATTVGRDDDVAIQLSEDLVSRRHAVIAGDPAGYTIRDLNSGNGVFVNGVREYQRKLVNGDRVQIGSFLLVFEISEEEAAAMEAASGRRAVAPGMTEKTRPSENLDLAALSVEPIGGGNADSTTALSPRELLKLRKTVKNHAEPRLVISPGKHQMVVSLGRARTLLGKSKECEIHMPDLGWFQGKAAVLERLDSGDMRLRRLTFWARLKVNGAAAKLVTLKEGDRIELGPYMMVYKAGLN